MFEIKEVEIKGNRVNELVLEIINIIDRKLHVFVETKNTPIGTTHITSNEDGSYDFNYHHFYKKIMDVTKILYIDEMGNEIVLNEGKMIGSNRQDLRDAFNKRDNFGYLDKKSLKVMRDNIAYFSNGTRKDITKMFWGNKYTWEDYLKGL